MTEVSNVVPINGGLEPYVSRQEMAGLMGISLNRLDHLVTLGMPSETWGLRRRVFRPSIALAWARDHGQAAA